MLEVVDLKKTYFAGRNPVAAVAGVSFEVPKGMIFTLLGPSGCGKTTTLRSIAGLETPDSGDIRVDGKAVYSSQRNIRIPANARGFGMVFQSYAIWPHMTVLENAAFPLQVPGKKARLSRREIEAEVGRVLEAVDLSGYESRRATQLSGGQQQRLALARALIAKPPLLLLDEPLSNLDAKLRERMRLELKRLQSELGITSVYVTHDQSEALALSHRIAVMKDGHIVQAGTPREIYDHPTHDFVAEFVGTTNFIAAQALEPAKQPAHYKFATQQGELLVATEANFSRGEQLNLSIRPEHLQVQLGSHTGPNTFFAIVETQVFLGFYQDLLLRIGDATLLARTHPSVHASPGTAVTVSIDPASCVVCRA
ncbi:MAG: ABC transporter ATP-binding protein [Burkholderiales bacterium]